MDNSAGGDTELAAEIARGLEDRGVAVELRQPDPSAMFDTSVHLVSVGLALRVPQRPEPTALDLIRSVVRACLQRHRSPRRRTRTVPVHLGETGRVLAWIDVFD